MSYRSKYHHIHGADARREGRWPGVRSKPDPWDSNYVAVNAKFVAYPCEGAGGAVAVLDATKPVRLSGRPPRINAHTMNVIDMAWSPFSQHHLLTSSADGTVKLWAIPADGLPAGMMDSTHSVQELAGHYKKVGNIGWHPTCANVAHTCSVDHTVKIWDVETGAANLSLEMENVPLHWSWDATGTTAACSLRNKKLVIVDPRAPEAVVNSTMAVGSMKGFRCVYATGQNCVVVTGFDRGSNRVIKVFDPSNFGEPSSKKDLDLSSGILMTFYDPDLGIVYCGGKGEGMIRMFDLEDGVIHPLTPFQSTIAQRGLGMMPKLSLDCMTHEIACFLKLTQDALVKVSIKFPRKSPHFQADLFPPTNGTTPSGDAASFFGGGAMSPIEKMSLAPGQRPEGALELVENEPVFQRQTAKALQKKERLEYMGKPDLIKAVKRLQAKVVELGGEMDTVYE